MRRSIVCALCIASVFVSTITMAYEAPPGRGRHRLFLKPGLGQPQISSRALTPSGPPAHPLDPLTAEEIRLAFDILKAGVNMGRDLLYPIVVLREPPKDEVYGFTPGGTFRREAYAEVLDRSNNRVFEAILDLNQRQLKSWRELPSGTQPAVTFTEYELLDAVVRSHKQWQKAMRKRGITNPDEVYLDGWVGGDPIPGISPGTRVMRPLSFFRGEMPNPYTRPIEGVVVAVDLNKLQVLEVTDTIIAPISANLGTTESFRAPSKPLLLKEPEGRNFKINGHEVQWQNWRFRYALHSREGLVIYTVSYSDQGTPRPVLYRAAFSEIVVPYAHPDSNWAWRAPRDIGEYGCGRYATSLQRGVDVPNNAVLVDAMLADDLGGVIRYDNAVALYERYGTGLWKRIDPESVEKDARIARELVISSDCWIGNYIYGVRWIFRQDGAIKAEVDLTGTLLLRGVTSEQEGNAYGTAVAPYLSAPDHQHFFSFRLDFDIDGEANSLVEINTHPIVGNVFSTVERPLRSELEARRDLNLRTNRYWKVINPSVCNAAGHPSGFSLWPSDSARPYASVENPGRKYAGFIDHHLWATAYDPEQMYAAGPYPNQSTVADGLPLWTADDDSLDNRDLVLWYTVGITHHPRVEEYPVMSAHHLNFLLRPEGLLSQNPALDIPPKSRAR